MQAWPAYPVKIKDSDNVVPLILKTHIRSHKPAGSRKQWWLSLLCSSLPVNTVNAQRLSHSWQKSTLNAWNCSHGDFSSCSIISPASELCKLMLFYTGIFSLLFPILSISLVNKKQLLLKPLKMVPVSERSVEILVLLYAHGKKLEITLLMTMRCL